MLCVSGLLVWDLINVPAGRRNILSTATPSQSQATPVPAALEVRGGGGTVQYCVLTHPVLYCIALYCIVLYCTRGGG